MFPFGSSCAARAYSGHPGVNSRISRRKSGKWKRNNGRNPRGVCDGGDERFWGTGMSHPSFSSLFLSFPLHFAALPPNSSPLFHHVAPHTSSPIRIHPSPINPSEQRPQRRRQISMTRCGCAARLAKVLPPSLPGGSFTRPLYAQWIWA